MFSNPFNTRTDPVLGAVEAAMKEGELRRQAVDVVNEVFGVYNRNAIIREQLADYDASIEEVFAALKEGKQIDESEKLRKVQGMNRHKHAAIAKRTHADEPKSSGGPYLSDKAHEKMIDMGAPGQKKYIPKAREDFGKKMENLLGDIRKKREAGEYETKPLSKIKNPMDRKVALKKMERMTSEETEERYETHHKKGFIRDSGKPPFKGGKSVKKRVLDVVKKKLHKEEYGIDEMVGYTSPAYAAGRNAITAARSPLGKGAAGAVADIAAKMGSSAQTSSLSPMVRGMSQYGSSAATGAKAASSGLGLGGAASAIGTGATIGASAALGAREWARGKEGQKIGIRLGNDFPGLKSAANSLKPVSAAIRGALGIDSFKPKPSSWSGKAPGADGQGAAGTYNYNTTLRTGTDKTAAAKQLKTDKKLPSIGDNKSYSVKKGDTLWKLAKDNNTTVDTLAKTNNIKNPNKILAGAKLSIPSSSSSAVNMKTPENPFGKVAPGTRDTWPTPSSVGAGKRPANLGTPSNADSAQNSTIRQSGGDVQTAPKPTAKDYPDIGNVNGKPSVNVPNKTPPTSINSNPGFLKKGVDVAAKTDAAAKGAVSASMPASERTPDVPTITAPTTPVKTMTDAGRASQATNLGMPKNDASAGVKKIMGSMGSMQESIVQVGSNKYRIL